MSYLRGIEVQSAIHARLVGDAALAAIVAGAVYDEMPEGVSEGTFVAIGEEKVRDRSDVAASRSEHRLVIAVISHAAGFATAKAAAAAVVTALADTALDLTPARAVGLWFDKADAYRMAEGGGRRIDLTFRLEVEG